MSIQENQQPGVSAAERALAEAEAALGADNPKRARALLRTALAGAPDSAAFQFAYGRTLLALGCHEEARDAFGKAVRLAPDVPAYRVSFGDSLRIMSSMGEAREQYLEAIRLAPDQAEGHFRLALLLFRLDEIPLAESHARSAQAIAPADAAIGELLARIRAWKEVQDCLARSLPTQAAEALRQMLGLEPEDARLLPIQLLFTQERGGDYRIQELCSTAIGHLAGNTELYLAECDAGLHGERVQNIFFPNPPICNTQLQQMWDRTLCVVPAAKDIFPLWNRIPSASHALPGSGYMRPRGTRDTRGLLHGSKPHLTFTPEEEALGAETLERMGIPSGRPFVCIHARDQAYTQGDSHTLTDSDFHLYRNGDIERMAPAARELARRGYAVVRIGARQEMPFSAGPGIMDYAMSPFRTDFMDIFLLGHCAFYFGSDSGVCNVAEIFRRPVVFVNFPVVGAALTWNPMPFIMKKQWSIAKGRYLTLKEIFQGGSALFMESALYEQAGIRLEENTAEEMLALAVEADERLKGTRTGSGADEARQELFWSIFKRHASPYLHGVYRALIGAAFLRDYPGFLD